MSIADASSLFLQLSFASSIDASCSSEEPAAALALELVQEEMVSEREREQELEQEGVSGMVREVE